MNPANFFHFFANRSDLPALEQQFVQASAPVFGLAIPDRFQALLNSCEDVF